MTQNLQWIIVGIIIILAAIYIIKRLISGKNSCTSGCENCPLNENCIKNNQSSHL